jgi:hypothetical protein
MGKRGERDGRKRAQTEITLMESSLEIYLTFRGPFSPQEIPSSRNFSFKTVPPHGSSTSSP